MAYYLGLDSSTQSLSALVIDASTGATVFERSLNFGAQLPEFRSPNGFLENADPQVRHSDPLMWVEALDQLLGSMIAAGFAFERIEGVSGAGQQHGSVYLRQPFGTGAPLTPDAPLAAQVRPRLSRGTSPIWMDSSTSLQCREIAEAAGGDAVVTRITGSRTIERFTGPQIRKFWQDDPDAYRDTKRIQLVSSFMASVLTDTTVAIDLGDGAGMNLLDLQSGQFSAKMLDATAPGLGEKLGVPLPGDTKVGSIAQYFVRKYGFKKGTPVVAFTGDNPSSLIGMGASQPGTAVVSLGTSDTVFAAMRNPKTDPDGYGHVFGNPAGGFMSLICFANGSLAREKVATEAGYDWTQFERAILEQTKPGNSGNLLLPFFVPEMTPRLQSPTVQRFGKDDFVSGKNLPALMRAVVEAQALSMQRHSAFIGETPTRLLVTGGASANRGVLQVLADVFQAEISTLSIKNSSALGGALRAANGVGSHAFAELYEKFVTPDAGLAVRPSAGSHNAYDSLRPAFNRHLDALLAGAN